jgi:hypothetical protein
MKLKPDIVIGWLHSQTPEHISLDLLEKAMCHNLGEPVESSVLERAG